MTIITGDCLKVVKTFPDNHFTAIVTDPPYGLSFMGKEWDSSVPARELWEESLRVVKAGGHLLSMGGSRTYHRLACSIEDAGWEIRDCIMWLYGSGFPKSKGCLKPAYEPIILARKKSPNPQLNIDACRIGTDDTRAPSSKNTFGILNNDGWKCKKMIVGSSKGRWPSNVILDEEAADMLDEESGVKASRFFYCAKASSEERNKGLDSLDDLFMDVDRPGRNQAGFNSCDRKPMLPRKNPHPTVKPLALMRYLITLISRGDKNLILDPFVGSGTTILAAIQLGFDAVGIETNPEYAKIARERISNEQAQMKMSFS